ncbi:MAG: helix-turn-helix domain-containing protein [Desulfovibrionaceae bacterium]|nr:helix-turn-helix domain-containing protein [Desulfovibrionaceae bacterium]
MVGSKALEKIVGENIFIRRKRRNLTQEKLAEMVGIGQQSLSRMERGHIAPRFDRLQELAGALGCPVAALFEQKVGDEPDIFFADMLRPLSPDSQKAVVNVAAEMARAMLKLERN